MILADRDARESGHFDLPLPDPSSSEVGPRAADTTSQRDYAEEVENALVIVFDAKPPVDVFGWNHPFARKVLTVQLEFLLALDAQHRVVLRGRLA